MRMALGLLLIAFLPAEQAATVAARDAPARTNLIPPDEPGEKLVVTGRVLGPDGKTPVPGASLYVYQTDKTGVYSRPVNDNRNPRLKGYLRTDAAGRYEYTTIKPASYPNTQNPAHIHYVVSADGYREKVFEIVFEDDPLVSPRIRASAAGEDSGFSIRPLERNPQGGLRCTQDVVLKR